MSWNVDRQRTSGRIRIDIRSDFCVLGDMTDTATEVCLNKVDASGGASVLHWGRGMRPGIRTDVHDLATILLLVALVPVALFTVKDYAISNDEGVQHRYGELIIAYYSSGFKNQDVFNFDNFYLYGGLFDIVAVALSKLVPVDPYHLRHILCAFIGIVGIGAVAATARMIAGPRAALIAAIALSVSGAWYGAMFNHTKDIPFAAAMMGATLYIVRIARMLPSPHIGDLAACGLLTGLRWACGCWACFC
jgi:hypothetical protein